MVSGGNWVFFLCVREFAAMVVREIKTSVVKDYLKAIE